MLMQHNLNLNSNLGVANLGVVFALYFVQLLYLFQAPEVRTLKDV